MEYDEFTDTPLFKHLETILEPDELHFVGMRAFKACKEQRKRGLYNEVVVFDYTAEDSPNLCEAFQWKDTKEGYDYWNEIDDRRFDL